MFRLRLLGGMSLEGDDGAVSGRASQRHRLALLALLAVPRHRPLGRERLCAYLWPERDAERSRNLLNQAVHALRRALGDAAIVSVGDELRLDPAWVECDATLFDAAVESEDWDRAAELYAGDFLDGFFLNEAPDFERWADAERDRLRHAWHRVLEALADAAEARGDAAGAVAWWRTLAAADPYSARVTRRRMEALEAAGDRAAAITQARVHALLLEEELGAKPSPDVAALAERMRREPARRTGPVTTKTPAPSSGPADVGTIDTLTTDAETADARPVDAGPVAVELDAAFGDEASRPVTSVSHRRVTAILGAAAILAGVLVFRPFATADRPPGAPADAPDPAVAVLPFRTTGAGMEIWQEGMVDLLSFNIDGLGELRKIDPQSVLSEWRRTSTAGEPAGIREALGVAERIDARYAVAGSVVRQDDAVRLTAEVYDVPSGRLRGTALIDGHTDSIFALVDRLTTELVRLDLLPSAGELAPINLSRITTTSVPALRAYLAGEQLYRRGRWQESAAEFRTAAELDPVFARALFRLAGSYWWVNETAPRSREYFARAVRLIERLPDRDALLIAGVANSSLASLQELTRRYPDDTDGWFHLGDASFHYGGVRLLPRSTFVTALERAAAQAPYYLESYVHLIEDAVVNLDSARAREFIEQYDRVNPEHCPGLWITYHLAWGTPAHAARAHEGLGTATSTDLECAWVALALAPAALEKLERLDRARISSASDTTDQIVALWRMLQARSMHGEMTQAGRILAWADSLPVIHNDAARWAVAFHASGYESGIDVNRAAAVLAAEPLPEDYFWLGMLALADGRWSDAEAGVEAIEAHPASRLGAAPVEAHGPTGDQSLALATALREYTRLLRGRTSDAADFERALARLDPVGFRGEIPGKLLRFVVGRLLLDRGRVDDARRYFESFYQYDWLYFVPAQFHLAQIDEAAGRLDDARRRYAIVEHWWTRSDAPLQAQHSTAREALAQLSDRDGNDVRHAEQLGAGR